MPSPDTLLILFVKHPRRGEVKTRLAAGIGEARALEVYRALLAHLRVVATPVAADKVVFYGNEVPKQDLWVETGWPRILQQGADLGARMAQAFAWGFARDYQRIALVGSDLPHLSQAILEEAFGQLQAHPAVLGPAADGGYYLIGLTRPVPAVFANMAWSTPQVAQETRRRLAAAGLSCGSLPVLSDLDTVEDLTGTFLEDFLPQHEPAPKKNVPAPVTKPKPSE
ncbi:MAG: glycosyltransferase [Bacteroidetes bacterium]|nr:MAG: glycosyltransferase [Bacteroidota bacterium]